MYEVSSRTPGTSCEPTTSPCSSSPGRVSTLAGVPDPIAKSHGVSLRRMARNRRQRSSMAASAGLSAGS
ncbi:hypothetical protein C1J01_31375 [Nonomuraea aridisoli]|uniref:Uncharacterized protein n=1 Tax=Nonomuraea aridisoli TaxID=2070368 RepID=A0A2W2EKR8_9ACTN|nr:hypothetical protein C1J01_31375 [Nonomuraea aridisoli]